MRKIDIENLKTQNGNYIRYFQGDITNKLQQVKLTQSISGWEKVKAYTIMPKYDVGKLPIENKPEGFAASTDPTLCLILEENWTEYNNANKADMRTKEILFQILFGLYQANATVGISLNSADPYGKNIYVKPETKTMHFALQIQNEDQYDYFTFESNHTVLIAPLTVVTDANPELTKIHEFFSEDMAWYGTDSWGSKFLNALEKPDQDYGSGIPWGLNLAFFHPIFQQFYKGEKKKNELHPDTFIFENGHRKNWLEQTNKDTAIRDENMKEAKKEVEDALKQEKTYKLEDFETVVKSLLTKYEILSDNVRNKSVYPNTNTDQTRLANDIKYEYEKILNIVKTENVNVGKITIFAPNEILEQNMKKIELKPWTNWSNIDYNIARGYIMVLLSLIAKITKLNVDWMLSSNNNVENTIMDFSANYTSLQPQFERIYNAYYNFFLGAQKKIEELRKKYDALEKQYDETKKIIDAQTDRAKQNVLPYEKLNAAKDVLDTVDPTNIDTKEQEAKDALDAATEEANGWQKVANNAKQEQTRLSNNRTRLGSIKTNFNNVNSELSKFTKQYPGKDWNALNTELEKIASVNSSEFDTKMTAFESKLSDLDSEISEMQNELATEMEQADALPDVYRNFDIPTSITKKSELLNYLNSNLDLFKDENVDAENISVDIIAQDQRKVTGLLHAIWGKQNNNTQAIVRGLNMADL